MSLMSAAEAGQTPGTGQEILPGGLRMAASAADGDGTGPEASSDDERPAEAGQATPARADRRLRLVSTEVCIREVRVAREVSTRTMVTGAPGPGPVGPQVSVPPPRGPRVQVRPPGQPATGQRSLLAGARASAAPPRGRSLLAGARASAAPPRGRSVRAERASVQRASVQRGAVPGASVQRVRLQRASGQRVSVRQTSVQPGRLRLTRRGRRVLTGFVMLVIVISAMLIWTGVAGGAQAPRPGAPARSVYQGMTQIVVQPGQTLWSIAAAAEPSADPRTAVQQISDVNGLTGTQIEAGQLLWVPRG
jgi:LysM domain